MKTKIVFAVTKFGLLVAQAPSSVLSISGVSHRVWDMVGGGGKEAGTIKITFPFAALWNEMAIPGVCGGGEPVGRGE